MEEGIMTRQEKIREMLARKIHIGGRIWAKIYQTEDPHNCMWEELSGYHQQLYLAQADNLLEYLGEEGGVIKVGESIEPLIEEE